MIGMDVKKKKKKLNISPLRIKLYNPPVSKEGTFDPSLWDHDKIIICFPKSEYALGS